LRPAPGKKSRSIRSTIEGLIEKFRKEGVPVEYYIAYGSYEKEITTFIWENKITLAVVGFPSADSGEQPGVFMDIIEKIRHQIDCRIEVVMRKKKKEITHVASVSADCRK